MQSIIGQIATMSGADAGEIDMGDDGELRARLEALRLEHRDLDDAIQALGQGIQADQLQLARLKRRKLKLRDEIAMVEDDLVPDIIA